MYCHNSTAFLTLTPYTKPTTGRFILVLDTLSKHCLERQWASTTIDISTIFTTAVVSKIK